MYITIDVENAEDLDTIGLPPFFLWFDDKLRLDTMYVYEYEGRKIGDKFRIQGYDQIYTCIAFTTLSVDHYSSKAGDVVLPVNINGYAVFRDVIWIT